MNIGYEELLAEQRAFFQTGKTKNIAFRVDAMKRLRDVIRRRYKDVQKALKADIHKCDYESLMCELTCTLDELNLMIKKTPSYARKRRVKTPVTLAPAKSYIMPEPYGTVLIMTAWNYPFSLAMLVLTDAISAGNCCIIKPSELAPATSHLIKEIVQECFDRKYVAVVEGGVEETTELLKHRFDFIHYTGSTRVGRIVAEAAAPHLTPVILELGGKSPCIIDETANIEITAKRIAWGNCLNSGQTCVEPDYLLVKRGMKEKVAEAIWKAIEDSYGKDIQKSPDFGRILNNRNFKRVEALIAGGHVMYGGHVDEADCYIEPTILDQVDLDSPLMQEEIFGPLLPIIEYDTLDEAIAFVNKREKPLALYIFSKSKENQEKILKNTSSGGVCINATIMHNASPYLAFGGVGNSGRGKYHAKAGFDGMSNLRGVLDKATWLDMAFFYAPFAGKEGMIKSMYKLK